MSRKILVVDSHPVQYRVPVWQRIEELMPGVLHVAYASDCSVRGYSDKDFGKKISWDMPLLSGYEYSILNCEKGIPLSGWGSLTGEGLIPLIDKLQPAAILQTGMNYRYDLTAYTHALRKKIPLWIRCETQDYAIDRSGIKAGLRSLVYRAAYLGFKRFFYIGELNKKHYLENGVKPSLLKPARYCTVDRLSDHSHQQKEQLRQTFRTKAGIAADALVIGFSGKFIPKKNPDILFHMLGHLPEAVRSRTHLYFMGSGILQDNLQELAAAAWEQYQVPSFFSGFVNQSEIAGHYLAMDIMVLPSLRMGETWGLVANEAMQAGCGVIVSDAVGCSADFGDWKKFRVFKNKNAPELAACITALAGFERDFDWALNQLEAYSVNATAEAIIAEMKSV